MVGFIRGVLGFIRGVVGFIWGVVGFILGCVRIYLGCCRIYFGDFFFLCGTPRYPTVLFGPGACFQPIQANVVNQEQTARRHVFLQ